MATHQEITPKTRLAQGKLLGFDQLRPKLRKPNLNGTNIHILYTPTHPHTNMHIYTEGALALSQYPHYGFSRQGILSHGNKIGMGG